MNFDQIQIKWKLLITYLAVVMVCILVALFATRELTISSYDQHLSEMAAMGMSGMMGGGVSLNLQQALQDTLNASLLWGGLMAAAAAVLLSLLISRRITVPIHEMAAVTGRIASGDYSERVRAGSHDEIGSLARSLNSMAASLEESERLRREMMANIAHELRTPLTSVSGYMEGFSDGVIEPSPENYQIVREEAARLSRLVDDLQRLSKAESGQEKLSLIDTGTEPFLRRIGKKMEPQFNEKQVALKVDVDLVTPNIRIDEDKMNQVFVNLLGNALRYTDSGGQVSLRAAGSNGGVQISVTDTGGGIAAGDLPHVFERFYRADKSRSRKRGGSGIGLSIAKRYVELQGGEISAQSKPGQGTTFRLTLPAAQP